MNVTIHTLDVALTDALRADVHALAEAGIRTMGAPPETEVLVTIRGPARRGTHGHLAEAVVNAPNGTLRAAGHGLDAAQAVAELKQALLRQATHWGAWHEGGPPATAGGSWMRGRRISEGAMREAARLGAPGEDPNADVTKRPRGYR